MDGRENKSFRKTDIEWEVLGMEKLAISILEAAELTSLSSHMIRKQINNGELAVYRVGRRILIPIGALHDLLGIEQTQTATGGAQ